MTFIFKNLPGASCRGSYLSKTVVKPNDSCAIDFTFTAMNGARANNRIFGLDIFRAAAILFVMQSHSRVFIMPHADIHYYWVMVLDGVDLFFVLSGFLIGGILIRTIDNKGFTWNQLAQFWTRRWFRTLPNYFLVLIVLLAGYYYAFNGFPDKFIQFFSFTQCFADPHPRFFPEAWSLAVEEWFYLLIPFGLFLLISTAKNKKRMILLWICFVIIAITVFRTYKIISLESLHTWDMDIRKQVLTRLDSIMYGFLGAYLHHYKWTAWEKRKNLLFITGLVILFGSRFLSPLSIDYFKYFSIIAQSIGALMLLPKLNAIVTGNGVFFKALTFISIISYSMYLLNYTLVLKIIVPKLLGIAGMDYQKNALHGAIGYILFWTITIVLSYVLYKFYEKPMMNLRERFKRRRIPSITN